MFLILAINIVVVVVLVSVIQRKGLERALPYFVFAVTLLPEECRIELPGLFDLYTHRLALIVLAIFFLVSRKKKKRAASLPLKNLILAHIGWVLASTLFSIVFVTSVKQLIAQVLEYYLLYYIILKSVTDVRTIVRISYAMVAAIGVSCIFGLFEAYAHWSVLSIFPAEVQLSYGTGDPLYMEMMDRGVRVRSTFPHPILFGDAIAMTIPLAFYLLTMACKRRLDKIILNAALILMFWNLYKTSSRGPWLATALALTILAFTAKAKIRQRIAAIAIVAITILIIRPGVADTLWNTYRATFNPEVQMGASFYYRSALLRTVTNTLAAEPARAVLGYGLGSFRENGLVIELPRIETHRWYTCDSSWILFLYETGYGGLVILATLLLKPAAMSLNNLRWLTVPDKQLSLAFFSSFAAFYVAMISVAIYGWGQNGNMLWTVIGCSIAYEGLKRDARRRTSQVVPGELPSKLDDRLAPYPGEAEPASTSGFPLKHTSAGHLPCES